MAAFVSAANDSAASRRPFASGEDPVGAGKLYRGGAANTAARPSNQGDRTSIWIHFFGLASALSIAWKMAS